MLSGFFCGTRAGRGLASFRGRINPEQDESMLGRTARFEADLRAVMALGFRLESGQICYSKDVRAKSTERTL